MLKWGIIGTGLIANRFATGVKKSEFNEILAVASRNEQTAKDFADKFNVKKYYGSYDEMLVDEEVEAVYISTPHPMHAEWAIKAARAKKHILVEKPIGINADEAKAIADIAEREGVFMMEAFMYRCHPQLERIKEIIDSGVLGTIRMIYAEFSYNADFDPKHRLFSQELGGGGILDVGCYPISFIRRIAGFASDKEFLNPVRVEASATFSKTNTDGTATAILEFENGVIANAITGVQLMGGSSARIVGTDGWLEVLNPWVPNLGSKAVLRLTKNYGETFEDIEVPFDKELYEYEADEVEAHVKQQSNAPRAMSVEDTIGNMETLDRWRTAIGMVYNKEKGENSNNLTITNATLSRYADAPMLYGKIKGIDKDISRLVIGADMNYTYPHTKIKFDEYFALGGNCFDTSYAYGQPNGVCEVNLGAWVKANGIRDSVVIIEKGANFPYDTPEGILFELEKGLDRLQMDYVDIYMMHRDNVNIPVGELLDAMVEAKERGMCTVFGVSNWSLERLMQTEEYAKKSGKDYFSLLSNQFSLAKMYDTPWEGYYAVSANTPEFIDWLTERQMPLFPWGSQARGFFTKLFDPNGALTDEMRRCWYSEENLKARENAIAEAGKLGVEPINIALKFVLEQPFPTFPLIGPMRYRELWSSLSTLKLL